MSRFVNPIGAAAAAMRKPIKHKVVQKLLQRSSGKPCEKEFMRLMLLLPKSPEDELDSNKTNRVMAAQKDFEECMMKANRHSEDYVSFRLKQLSAIAATKKRRRRTETGRGRWNPSRVY